MKPDNTEMSSCLQPRAFNNIVSHYKYYLLLIKFHNNKLHYHSTSIIHNFKNSRQCGVETDAQLFCSSCVASSLHGQLDDKFLPMHCSEMLFT